MRKIPVLMLALIANLHLGPIAFAEPMSFRLAGTGGNCVGCEWIAAQGDITPDTPAKFEEYITENGKPYHIVLNSAGGSLIAGIQLGKLIREQGATTLVGKTVQVAEPPGLEHLEEKEDGVYAFSCAFAFMGGVERYVGPDDLLGVHQFYSTGKQMWIRV